MLRFMLRLMRRLLFIAIASALAAKFLLESNAEEDTEEIDLVAIFEGKRLRSSADPFYGGQIFTMFGGVSLDLREARPAPTGVKLNIAVIAGGVDLVVPEGWRVDFEGNVYLGGWSDETRTTADEDATTVTVTGYLFMGGLRASAPPPRRE